MSENQDTHTVEYTGEASVFRHSATGLSAGRADRRIGGLSEGEADDLVATGEFEHVAPADIDESEDEPAVETTAEPEPEPAPEAPEPLDGTVPEIEDALATGEYDDDLVDLYNEERDHENRSTAIEAIQDRRDTLREQNTADGEE